VSGSALSSCGCVPRKCCGDLERCTGADDTAVSALAWRTAGATSTPPSHPPGRCVRAWPTPPGDHHRQAHGLRRRQARGVVQGGPAATALSAPWRRKRPPADAPAGTPGAGLPIAGARPALPCGLWPERAALAAATPPPPRLPSTGTRRRTDCPPGKHSRVSSPPHPRTAPGRQAPAGEVSMSTGN
jgi:hypothetical protein